MLAHLPYVFAGGFVMLGIALGLLSWLKPNPPAVVWMRVFTLSAFVSAFACFTAPASALTVMVCWLFLLVVHAPAYKSTAARIALLVALIFSVGPMLGIVAVAPTLVFWLWSAIYAVGIGSAIWSGIRSIRW